MGRDHMMYGFVVTTSWPEIGGHDPLPLEAGEGPVKTNVLIARARASDKINEIHGARPQMHGRAADLVGVGGGGGGGGGLASLQTTEQLVTLQQPDKKFLHILPSLK